MTSRARDLLVAGALVLAVAGIFGPAARHGFVEMDDRSYVIDNAHVLGGPTAENIAWAFTTFLQANWHPLTWISLQVDAALGGGRPALFHVTSIALHAAAAVLLYLALRSMTGSTGRSAAVALLFAIHPLRAESVVWIAERKDVLSQALGFGALLAWAGWVKAPGRGRYATALGLFAAALLAKPMMVTLPAVLLLLDRWPQGRIAPLGPRLREKLPFFALSVGSAVVTFVAQSHGGAVVELGRLPLATRLANAAVAAVDYLVATVWPSGLAIPYPYASLTAPRVLLCTIVLATLTILAGRAWTRRPHLAVGWLWYLVTLLPVAGIVQVGAQAMADRYSYLPMVGPLISVVWEIADRVRAKAVAWSLVAAAAVPAAVLTARQVALWRDTETLMRHTLAVTGPNATAHLTLGMALLRSDRRGEGIAELRKAVAIAPHMADAWVGLAEGLVADGRGGEALDAFRRARSLDPSNAVVREKLVALLNAEGIDRMRDGDFGGSEPLLREAIAVAPGLAASHGSLGVLLARAGRLEEAERELAEAVRLDPANEGFRSNLERVVRMRQ